MTDTIEYRLFHPITMVLGVPEDQLKLLTLILSGIPLGLVNYFIKNGTYRLIYGLLTGFVLQFLVYGTGVIHTFLATVVTYLFVRFCGRKQSALWILALSVLHLSSLHIYRMFVDYGNWSIDDPTTIYMMSICKFSSVAFSYEDGALKDDEIKSEHHRLSKIVEMPTLLEMFSFVYYFPSSIIGPCVEFADFRKFVYLEGYYQNIPLGLTLLTGFGHLMASFVFMAIYAGLKFYFDISFVSSQDFGHYNFFYRFMYLYAATFVHRAKYYSAWLLSFSGVIFCGLAYNVTPRSKTDPAVLFQIGGDTEIKFDKGEYGSIIQCEMGPNPREKIVMWNRTVHLWLKYNVFLRVMNINHPACKGNRSLASLLTFMISAFWHGFYPCYYLFSFLFYLFEQSAVMLEDKLNYFKWIERQNIFAQVLSIMWFQFLCNSMGTVFFNLRFSYFLIFMKNFYGIPLIAIITMYVGLRLMKSPKREKETRSKPSTIPLPKEKKIE